MRSRSVNAGRWPAQRDEAVVGGDDVGQAEPLDRIRRAP
jgi:hypothetical protein